MITTFQYRKRYEVTCDCNLCSEGGITMMVSIPQAV